MIIDTNTINNLIEVITSYIEKFGPLFAIFSTFLESLLPMLPLNVLVTFNVNAFGYFFGILLSLIGTVLGAFVVYLIFNLLSDKFIKKHLPKKYKDRILKGEEKIKNMSFSALVLLITIPFTPSFLINILSGISGMSKRKFISAIIIGKLFLVTYWGIIGKSLIDNIKDIKVLLILVFVIILSFITSKIISKKFNI